MSIEQNKTVVRRYIEEVWDQNKVEVLAEIVTPDYIDHAGPPNLPAGPDAVKAQVMVFRTGIPDMTCAVEMLIAEGDFVTCRFIGRGTHTGSLMGIPPTGRAGQLSGTHIYRIENGKIAERWGNSDDLGLLQQLGVIPAMS